MTVRNEHHHFLDVDRDNVQNKSLFLLLPEAWQDPPPPFSVVYSWGLRERISVRGLSLTEISNICSHRMIF